MRLLLSMLCLCALLPAARADDVQRRQQLNSRLQTLQRVGSYAQVASIYVELASLEKPSANSLQHLVSAGRNYLYAYRYRGRDKRNLALARMPLRRALELCDQLKQPSYAYQAYDILADVELSSGNPRRMLTVLDRYLARKNPEKYNLKTAKFKADMARLLLGEQDAESRLRAAIKLDTNLRYQLQNVVTELSQLAGLLQRKPGARALHAERGLRTQAASFIALWEDGHPRRHFNEWSYRWAGELLVQGGRFRAARRLLDEMNTRIARKPLNGSYQAWWQNQRLDYGQLYLSLALLGLGRPKDAWWRLSQLVDQVYLIDRNGRVVGRGQWLGRERRGGRWFTRIFQNGRTVFYYDLAVFSGGLIRSARGERYTKKVDPRDTVILERPYRRVFAVIDGLARAATATWERDRDPVFLKHELLPSLRRVRSMLRRMQPRRYRSIAGKDPFGAASLLERGWQVELGVVRALQTLGLRDQARGELQRLLLAQPPTRALRRELSELAAADAPRDTHVN